MHKNKTGDINAPASKTRTYYIWRSMRERCRNPNHPEWYLYGGRGITVDPRWESYENFLRDMGERPDGMSIDRIDNDLGYSKDNCRWATPQEQARNRRTCVYIQTPYGKMCLKELAERLDVNPARLKRHLERGNMVFRLI
jgi:hypothetical protein